MAQTNAKKFKVALAAMAFALVAVVGGLIGVWAATSQTVKSSFDVQYNVSGQIAGTMTATYQRTGLDESPVDMVAGEATSIIFGVDDTLADVLSADASAVALAPKKTEIVFTYTFTNTGETAYTATLVDGCKASNIKIVYAGTGVENVTKDVAYTTAEGGAAVASGIAVDVPVGDATITVTVTVNVDDTNKSAFYTSTTDAGLVWNLEAGSLPTNP